MALSTKSPRPAAPDHARALMLVGLVLTAASLWFAHRGVAWVKSSLLIWVGAGLVLWIDGWVHRHRHESLLLTYPTRFFLLALLSATLWSVLELFNTVLGVWVWEGLPTGACRHGLFSLGTALFGLIVMEMSDVIQTAGFFRSVKGPTLAHTHVWAPAFLGALLLGGVLVWPAGLYPVLWFLPVLLFDPLNERVGQPSLMAEARVGQYRSFSILVTAGLVLGAAWGVTNALAGVRLVPGISSGLPSVLATPVLGLLALAPGFYAGSVWATSRWERGSALGRAAGILIAVALIVLSRGVFTCGVVPHSCR